MSNRTITDVASHLKAIERADATNKRITSDPCWEVSDSGLSLWAADSSKDFARFAIQALKYGEEIGYSGPAYPKLFLVYDGKPVDAKKFSKEFYGKTKWSWVIKDEYLAKKLGRKFIPAGKNSRIQKELGLSERLIVVPVKRTVDAHCSFLGGYVGYTAITEDDLLDKYFDWVNNVINNGRGHLISPNLGFDGYLSSFDHIKREADKYGGRF